MAPLDNASRRRFLIRGTSSLAFACIAARAQRTPSLPVAAGAPDTAAAQQDGQPITTASDAASRLTVDVRIDGNGPYRFVVDTGADRTVLASEIAVELGLLRGERVMMEGVVRAVATETVTLRELTIGSVSCPSLVVPILPRSMLEADGYLGLDTLDGHRVTFDFKKHVLRVGGPRSRFGALWQQPNETRIRTVGSSGHLRALHCTVDGVTAAAFIDSGAQVSAGNPPLLAALGERTAYSDLGTISVVGITGGQTWADVTIVKKIQMLELEFTDCPLLIADFPVFDVWGLRRQPALLIGMNMLRQFSKVSIDYGLKELRFDLANLSLLQAT